jgi:hypothetical protein
MKIKIYEFFEEWFFSHGSWANPSLGGINKKKPHQNPKKGGHNLF